MNRYKIVAFVLTLSLLICSNVQLAFAEENNYVSESEATTVAEQFLKKYNFSNTIYDLELIQPVFDIENRLLGYYFKLKDSYVLVSASKEYSPVLAAGGGDLLISNIDDDGKLYYFGGLFGAKAKSGDKLLQVINDNKKTNQTLSKDNFLLKKNPKAKKSWDNYLNSTYSQSSTDQPSTLALTQKKLTMTTFNQWDSNVKSSYQSSACGPTTMAAIIEYWRVSKGKSLLNGLNTYTSKGDMINHMYSSHDGNFLGMSVSKLKSGLVAHASESYSTASSSTISGYTNYRTEISNNRPVAIKFDQYFTIFEPDHDYAYEYHWVVGKGYAYDSFDQMFIINNNISSTDSGQEQYLDFPTNEPILSLVSFNIS